MAIRRMGFIAGMIAALAIAAGAHAERRVIDRIVAVVDDEAIFESDVQQAVRICAQHSMPIMDIGTQAATTLIRPVFHERGFRRITICTS